MYIFQPTRFLIRKAIKEQSHYIKGKVLDAGSGGFLRYKKLFKFDEYLTLDINKENNPDIVGSLEKIPLGDSEIDSIVCTSVLGDLLRPEIAIQEFNRILKKDGHCLLTENFFAFMHDQPNDYFRFTNFYLEKLFSENGFKVVHSERIGGFFSMITQAKVRYLILKFNLYNHKIIGWIFSKAFSLLSRIAMFLDSVDKSSANNSCAIAWLVIAKKI